MLREFFRSSGDDPDQIVVQPGSRHRTDLPSGTIALTLMFNDRSLPIAVFSRLGPDLLGGRGSHRNPLRRSRVTAFGLYLRASRRGAFAHAAGRARRAGKPIAVVKSGAPRRRRAPSTATREPCREDSVFDAFCRQAGIARCDTLGTLCETLKLFTRRRSPRPQSSHHGASAATCDDADVSRSLDLDFAAMPSDKAAALGDCSRIASRSPILSIFTPISVRPAGSGTSFLDGTELRYDAVGSCWILPLKEGRLRRLRCGIEYHRAGTDGSARAALIASLPETISARTRQRCLAGGVVPLQDSARRWRRSRSPPASAYVGGRGRVHSCNCRRGSQSRPAPRRERVTLERGRG